MSLRSWRSFTLFAFCATVMMPTTTAIEPLLIRNGTLLSHATEAYKVADLLAERRIPVVVGPISTQADRVETPGAIYDNAARLQEAGVIIAIQTGDSPGDARSVRMLPCEASVAYGLPWEAAIRALTVNPAETSGRPIPLTSHHTELYEKCH